MNTTERDLIQLATPKEVAAMLRLSISALRLLRLRDASFPAPIKIGGRVLWRVHEVNDWIKGK